MEELEHTISAENDFDPEKFKLTYGFKPKSDSEVEQSKEELQEQEGRFKITKRLDLLDEEGDKELTKTIMDSRGVVRVLVHPYHVPDEILGERDLTESDLFSHVPHLYFLKMIRKENSTPIIIFEDEVNLSSTREIIDGIFKDMNVNKHVYILPTVTNTGFVRLLNYEPPKNGLERETYISQQTAYAALGMRDFVVPGFCQLGIKKILVNGSAMVVNDAGLNRCLGSFVKFFGKMNDVLVESKCEGIHPIKIQIGAATSPHGRKELKEAGYTDLL